MHHLIKFELKKLFTGRVMLCLVAVLLAANAFFVWRAVDERTIQREKDLASFLELYEENPDELDAYMEDFLTLYRATIADRTLERPESIYAESDYVLFNDFAAVRDFSETYDGILARAKKACENKILEYRYFGYAENSFEMVYQTSVLESYGALNSLDFPLLNVVGYDVFFTYNGFCVFLLVAISLCGIMLVSNEKNAGMLMILRSTRRGRVETFLAKIAVGFVFTSLLCVLFTLTTLGVLYAKIGLVGWKAPLQMVDAMQLAPYQITIGEGVVLSLLARIFSAFVFFVIVLLVASLFNNNLVIFGTVFIVIGVNFALANYQFLDGYSFFRNINFFWCLDGLRILEEWRGVKLFGRCIALLPTWLIVYGILAIAVGAIGCYVFAEGISVGKTTVKINIRLPKIVKLKRKYHTSLYRFEMKKALSVFACLALIASTVMTVYFAEDSYVLKKDFSQNFYAEYMAGIEGPYTEEKHLAIESEYREYQRIIAQKESMQIAYQSGEITSTEYNQFLSKSIEAERMERVFERLYEHSRYLKEQTEAGYDVAYFDDSGWLKLSEINLARIGCIALILLCSDLFSMEIRTGFVKIQSLTKRGRKPVTMTKFLLALTFALFIGVFSEALQFIFADMGFTLCGGEYSLVSIEGFTKTTPVWLYFALEAVKNVALFVFLAFATAGLSKLTGKLVPTLCVMTVIVFAPMIFSYFGIEAFEKLSFLNLFGR